VVVRAVQPHGTEVCVDVPLAWVTTGG
jgi:hypothetical protein